MRQFHRSTRLGEQILRDISTMLEIELSENISAMVTFTSVRMTNDLRQATVYYSVLGQENQRSEVQEYFIRENKRIRRMIGKKLRIRHIPELRFKFDPSVEEGIRIEKLLSNINNDEN
ncbi:MAG: 30S ribosome-binding factor RbfA [Candidatus Zixiibacteriota bacterium]|nr:MAG: 30S ribosome-binding factor RbfA [candidate division Zixibacteria bacterium]